MLANQYNDLSVQKGGVPGVSGCIEHIAVVTQTLKEAKVNKGDIAVLWLDLANAHGSIPHKLVDLTLERYHVPDKYCKIIDDYFNKIKLRFTVGNDVTTWQRLEVGIATGCTVSVILFAAAMNMLIKSVETSSRGPIMASVNLQHERSCTT